MNKLKNKNYSRFRTDIEFVINRNPMENGSDTPDFILAEFLIDQLIAFDKMKEGVVSASVPKSSWLYPYIGYVIKFTDFIIVVNNEEYQNYNYHKKGWIKLNEPTYTDIELKAMKFLEETDTMQFQPFELLAMFAEQINKSK